jgi:hypothetical protein
LPTQPRCVTATVSCVPTPRCARWKIGVRLNDGAATHPALAALPHFPRADTVMARRANGQPLPLQVTVMWIPADSPDALSDLIRVECSEYPKDQFMKTATKPFGACGWTSTWLVIDAEGTKLASPL